MTKTDMQPFPTPTPTPIGGVCPVMSYLDPPMGTSVTRQPDLNQIITRNDQFFSLANQGNSDLKVFLTSVLSCNSISVAAVRSWYMLFSKMAATTGVYLHPYFYFRKHANSDYGSTSGFDTAPVAHIPAVPEILHQACRNSSCCYQKPCSGQSCYWATQSLGYCRFCSCSQSSCSRWCTRNPSTNAITA